MPRRGTNYRQKTMGIGLSLALTTGLASAAELPQETEPIQFMVSARDNYTSYGSVLIKLDLEQPISLETTTQTAGEIEIFQASETEQLLPAVRVDPPDPPPPPPIPHYLNWLALAECESDSNWSINTGNGFYGGLQFTLSSWRTVGGQSYAPRPDLATPEEQMLAAEDLLIIQGWRAWPACSRKLGYR